MPSISKQSIIIIGGSSGIGFAVARLSLKADIRVAIVSSNSDRIATAVDILTKEFPDQKISGHTCNLKTENVESDLEKALLEASAAHDNILFDHIIFSAGDQLRVQPLKDIDVNLIHEAGRVRFVAPLIVAKLAPRFLSNHYSSSLILTSGFISQKPVAGWSVVGSYASGLSAMTRNLAVDLKPIRVNLVIHGAVDTELWGPNRETAIAEYAKNSFMGRVATAEEAAESYIYLMKDTNATGSAVSTNGGGLL